MKVQCQIEKRAANDESTIYPPAGILLEVLLTVMIHRVSLLTPTDRKRMNQTGPLFRKPNLFERTLNKAFGVLVGLGIGLRHNYLVELPGRKTGRLYSTPIDLLEFNERRFLVAPRGRTKWVRNAESAGEIVLKRGRVRQKFRVRIVSNEEKPEVLKAYLDRFTLTVQRYFPVPAGSGPEAFTTVAEQYPVFELLT